MFQYYDSLSEAGIALEVELEEHLHYATDPELWERLLQNMLSNVLKHGKEQARLTLMSDADTIRVELRNIVQQPIQHLDQLASRFYSENLSDTEESSGLGLYIIQNFVEILGGDLQLATEADWFILTITLNKKGLSIAQAFCYKSLCLKVASPRKPKTRMNPRAIERVLVVAVVLCTKEYWNSKFR